MSILSFASSTSCIVENLKELIFKFNGWRCDCYMVNGTN